MGFIPRNVETKEFNMLKNNHEGPFQSDKEILISDHIKLQNILDFVILYLFIYSIILFIYLFIYFNLFIMRRSVFGQNTCRFNYVEVEG